MDIHTDRKQKRFLKEKISRFKPVAFLRRNVFVFSLLFLFSLSLVFGFWDIKKYEMIDINGEEISENVSSQVGQYMEEKVFGINFFTFSSKDIESDIVSNISYIESVNIEKIAPNKLSLFISIYKPEYIADLQGECFVLSGEGVVLQDICIESAENCCLQYSEQEDLPLFSSASMSISMVENGKKELLVVSDIDEIVSIVELYEYNIDSVSLKDDILEIQSTDGKIFRFTIAENTNEQMARFMIVINKIKSDNSNFSSLDLRFERPVMQE